MSETAQVCDDQATVTSGIDFPDVSGIPSAQLKALVEEHLDVDLGTLAERVGIDKKYLKRLVVEPTTPVVKLGMADRILMALDLDMSVLTRDGVITIVPLRGSRSAAMKIVDDEIWLAEESGLPTPTEEEVQARVDSLLSHYEEHCTLTAAQIAFREKDKARKTL